MLHLLFWSFQPSRGKTKQTKAPVSYISLGMYLIGVILELFASQMETMRSSRDIEVAALSRSDLQTR